MQDLLGLLHYISKNDPTLKRYSSKVSIWIDFDDIWQK